MSIRPALKAQLHATLHMLRDAIERCPDGAWDDGHFTNPFWHVAYHVLFYTDLYLHPDETSFKPWRGHRPDLNFMGTAPGNPPRSVGPGEPLTRTELLEYWDVVDGRIDSALDSLDLDAAASGFWWYDMPKLEHVLLNLRHLAHHTGQLAERVRSAGATGVGWVPRG
jgi:hypothetical protein